MTRFLNSTRVQPYACATTVFILNLILGWRLFRVEFTTHMDSNEGLFMSISRVLVEHGFHFDWFPYWMNGVPFENTYSPLLQIINAVVAMTMHWSTARAFHFTLASFYCLGPMLLFVFAWRLSGQLRTSFLAALVYSLFSPSIIYAPVRADIGGWLHARRLHTMVVYGEAAHNIAIALLPLALLFIWLAITRKSFRWDVAAGAALAVLVLMNAFAVVDLLITTCCLLAYYGGLQRVSIIATLAYLTICPFLTPTLIHTIQANSALNGFHMTTAAALVDILIVSGAIAIWWFCHRHLPFEGFVFSLAWIFTAIPSAVQFWGIVVLPQADRYHLEMEFAIGLAILFAARPLLKPVTIAILVCFLITQFFVYRNFARGLIQKIDVTKTVEYRTARWIATHLPGKRIMAGGDVRFWFNVFADNPQFTSGADPFSPNWMQETASYAIYSGEGAGDKEGEIAVLWLKAFGCHAVSVPGPASKEAYHPFRNPKKFEGVLPVLWKEGDDTIYAVPQRSDSMAYVVPASAVIQHLPESGLDTREAGVFVSAMEDPSLPLASLNWSNRAQGIVKASLQPGQVFALSITYDPGWVATANGRAVPIMRDGIGLMTLRPECNGPCEVRLSFEGGLERLLCRVASGLTLFAICLVGLVRVWRKRPRTYRGATGQLPDLSS